MSNTIARRRVSRKSAPKPVGLPFGGERRIPHDSDSENALLSSLFVLGWQGIEDVQDTVKPEDFFHPNMGEVYRVLCEFTRVRRPLEVPFVADELRKRPALQAFGESLLSEVAGFPGATEADGESALNAWAFSNPDTGLLPEYAKSIASKSVMRKLIVVGSEITQIGYADAPLDGGAAAALEDAERRVFALRQEHKGHDGRSTGSMIGDMLKAELVAMRDRSESESGITGIPSGYPVIDDMTGGWQPGDFIIVAARPSVGKSVLASCFAVNAAKADKSGIFFALEMKRAQVAQRIIAAEGSIDLRSIRIGLTDEKEREESVKAVGRLLNAKLYVDENTAATVPYMLSTCRRHAARYGLDFVIVDYLQLMCTGDAENRNIEVSQISRGLKLLAGEFGIPVIAVSQLSRGVERRENKRPTLSDVRDSGAIEQDADAVIFIHNEAYYDRNDPEKAKVDPRIIQPVEINIAKQRQGPVGTVMLGFSPAYVRFVNLDTQHDPPPVGSGLNHYYLSEPDDNGSVF